MKRHLIVLLLACQAIETICLSQTCIFNADDVRRINEDRSDARKYTRGGCVVATMRMPGFSGYPDVSQYPHLKQQLIDSQNINATYANLIEVISWDFGLYNCHNFAWGPIGWNRPENRLERWMSNPSMFLTDGTLVNIGSIPDDGVDMAGYLTLHSWWFNSTHIAEPIAFFGSGGHVHSGIWYDTFSVGPTGPSQKFIPLVISKWGRLPLMLHPASEGYHPYRKTTKLVFKPGPGYYTYNGFPITPYESVD